MRDQKPALLRRAAKVLETIRDLPASHASEQMRDETAEYLFGLANALEGTTEITGTAEDSGPHKGEL